MNEFLTGLPATPSRSDIARARLLEAGLKLFGERNADAVSTRDIAAASGQNLAAISYYFGSKDGLYQAVLEAMIRIRDSYSRPVVEEFQRRMAAGDLQPEDAASLLKRLLRVLFLGYTGTKAAPDFASIVMREQMHPTPVFDRIYREGMEPLHRMVTQLVAVMTGEDAEDPKTILRAHAVAGQIHSFLMARETILRRLGWPDFNGERAEEVAAILEESIDIFLAGFRTRKHRAGGSSKVPRAAKQRRSHA